MLYKYEKDTFLNTLVEMLYYVCHVWLRYAATQDKGVGVAKPRLDDNGTHDNPSDPIEPPGTGGGGGGGGN